MGLEFRDDVPFSTENSVGYRELFVFEQWLRRFTHTALMARVGPRILGGLPAALVQDLKARVSALPSRMHLGVETADEPLWTTTLEELRDLLLSDSLFPIVRELTGYHRPTLGSKLGEIREIRNVIGHNRAVSEKTIRILEADLLSLEDGISAFKHSMFLDRRPPTSSLKDDRGRSLEGHLARRARRSALPIPREALILAESKYFFFAAVVPREPFAGDSGTYAEIGSWVHGQTTLRHFARVMHLVVAFALPRRGGCFTVIWPKMSTDVEHREIVDAFLGALEVIWTDEEYSEQDPRFICNPKFWFTGAQMT